MTQQSLITRLKAVEEALEYAEHRLSSSHPEVARDTRTNISEPLSDLRELIKEAEGQEQFGVWHSADDPDESDFFIGDAVDALDCNRCKPLYTALGEKPAAAEQQLAKEKKE